MEFHPHSTVVITVHCQGDVIGPDGAFAPMFHEQVLARGVIDKIRDLQESARQAGSLVVYTRVAWAQDYSDMDANSPLLQGVVQSECLKEGSPQAEILDVLSPQEEDVVITHQRVGGWTSELVGELENRDIKTLLFCGVATNVSVESTARAASDAGYHVIVVEDACSAATPQAHQSTVESLSMLGDVTVVSDAQRIFQGLELK